MDEDLFFRNVLHFEGFFQVENCHLRIDGMNDLILLIKEERQEVGKCTR